MRTAINKHCKCVMKISYEREKRKTNSKNEENKNITRRIRYFTPINFSNKNLQFYISFDENKFNYTEQLKFED